MTVPALFRPRSLSRYRDPFDTIEQAMQRFFEDMPTEMAESGYPVDISEEEDRLIVDAEMPGFKNEEIELSIIDDALSIDAERSSEQPKGKTHLQERRYTRVHRTFRLPNHVDPESVDAKLDGGVLHIEMKKAEGERPKKITVK